MNESHACSFPRLDALYLNAGVSMIEGVDWKQGPLRLITSPSSFFTDVSGTLKQRIGVCTPTHPQLGSVFAANMFGHYLLLRGLEPLLSTSHGASRVIWTDSQTSDPDLFSWSDIQGLHSDQPYESSKYATEILVHELNAEYQRDGKCIRVFVADPGVVATNIVAGTLSWLMSVFIMVPVLWLAQWVVDSVTFNAYDGAISLFYLSGWPGVKETVNVASESDCTEKDTTACKYSSASRRGTCFVVRRTMHEGSGGKSLITELNALKLKLAKEA